MSEVSEVDVDELGSVDYIVVEFPGSKFNGETAPALADLVAHDQREAPEGDLPPIYVPAPGEGPTVVPGDVSSPEELG